MTGIAASGGVPIETWERALVWGRRRLASVSPRVVWLVARVRAWGLWAGLGLLLVLLVVRPVYRQGLAVYAACGFTLVLWFAVSRTRTVSWFAVAQMFAVGVVFSWVIAWASFRLVATIGLGVWDDGPGTAVAGLTEESLKLVPLVVVALVAPGRVRRFAAADWLLLGLAAGMGFQAWEDLVRRVSEAVSPSLGGVLGQGAGSGYPQHGWGLLSGGFGTWRGGEVWGYPGHHVTTALVAGCAGLGVALWRSGTSPWRRAAAVLLPVTAWLAVMADHVGYNASLHDVSWTDTGTSTAPWALRTWWDTTGQGTGRGWLLLVVLVVALLVDAGRLHRAGPVTDLPAGDGWWARPRLLVEAVRARTPSPPVTAVAALAVFAARDVMAPLLAYGRAPGESRRAAAARGRATAMSLRRVRMAAIAADLDQADVDRAGAPERGARAVVRAGAAVALGTLLAVGLLGAALLARRIGAELTPAQGFGWLAGQMDGLGRWWDGRSTSEKVVIGAGIAALVALSGGSFALALGVSGAAVYVAEHGEGAATLVRDPGAATRDWWATTTPTEAAVDVAEFGLTFAPGNFGGALAGRQLREVAGFAAGDAAVRRYYRGGWEGGPGLRLTAGDYAAVRATATHAAAAEASITPRLQDVVADLPHGRLIGLEYRLKETESLARKVATKLGDATVRATAADVSGGMKDVVRYTVEVPTSDYAVEVAQAASGLRARGFEVVEWKNTWAKPGYQGINSFWRDRSTGQLLEIQFHTPESFEAKMTTHELYEQARLPGVDQATREALGAEQNEVFGRIPRPAGAADLTTERFVP
jgi:hypothetical protein